MCTESVVSGNQIDEINRFDRDGMRYAQQG
ncbi:hypothetical protein MMON44395_21735 [Mycolicibacterium monacense DSM 44395]|nr:hypothetical protein [Mycolicibacterium monacense DSM 44395]